MTKYGQNNRSCWQSCSWCSLDIGYQEVLCSVDKSHLLIHNLNLFQLEIGWGRESFGMCFIPLLLHVWDLSQGSGSSLKLWSSGIFFFFSCTPSLWCLANIDDWVFQWVVTCSGEPPKSLAARNAVLPSTSGITFCFLSKILAFDLIKRDAFSCYLSAGCSRQNSLKWNLCLASVSINRLGFLHNFA